MMKSTGPLVVPYLHPSPCLWNDMSASIYFKIMKNEIVSIDSLNGLFKQINLPRI